MDTTPASLLERLRNSKPHESWERFVRLYTPLIFFWARRTGLQDADAADLVQDVLTLLLKKLPEFVYEPGKSFRAWLRTVTLNKWRERRRNVVSEAPAGSALEEAACVSSGEPFWEGEFRQRLFARALELMRSEFQPTTWKACWAQVVEGKTAAEIGQELGLTAGAARVAKFRVLCRLRQELNGMLD